MHSMQSTYFFSFFIFEYGQKWNTFCTIVGTKPLNTIAVSQAIPEFGSQI